ILYDPRGILRRLMLRWNKAKLSSRVLEKSLWDAYHNIIEYSGKLRNGWLNRNDFLTRYSARIVAEHVERAIIALNDLSIISENYLHHRIRNAGKKPKHLNTDYPLAVEIKGTEATDWFYESA